MDKPPSDSGFPFDSPSDTAEDTARVLRELRARAAARTLDWDEIAYRASVASRTLRRWVRGEIAVPSPRLVERIQHVLAA